ncbi:hypothetical protein A8L34_28210 [Bacillus sp. FJAT-27264]|uniref:hypothetical protein n=1 Tax=Paenibacillus sp. (strain DSM 101736 / FJAT-27264) TaxID=1850362 RepID=UPI000807E662|nr:hypothetical protein [Bacillus sp. FJAT-27264]OBZ15933.1 hypothetical protein A8L34_28210 [Bacillus sp. FJAT-27264]
MTKMKLDFLGHPIEVDVQATTEGMTIQAGPEALASLEIYLSRALPYLNPEFDKNHLGDLPALINEGIEWEQKTDKKLEEPLVKLPYDIPVTSKTKLDQIIVNETIKAGSRVTQTKVLTNMIIKKHKELFGGK